MFFRGPQRECRREVGEEWALLGGIVVGRKSVFNWSVVIVCGDDFNGCLETRGHCCDGVVFRIYVSFGEGLRP